MEQAAFAALLRLEGDFTTDAENERRRAAVSIRSARRAERARALVRTRIRVALANGLRRAADVVQPPLPVCPPVATNLS